MSEQNETRYLSLMKAASKKINNLQTELEALKRAQEEPIAIIGMACRFPGNADSPEAFWQLLRDGQDAVTLIPPDRWNTDAYYDPDPETAGKMYNREAGIVNQWAEFDADFFTISPREAESIDPQQRLLLEVSWEALENAGLAASQLAGTQTGVFIGLWSHDYVQRLLSREASEIDAYMASGNLHSATSGRLSYFLGLQGPNLALDSACSSSLTAVHLACQSLRNQESNLALAGGVNLMLSPEYHLNFCRARMLSPTGRCKTFDAAADGYVRSEGCGVIVLKRLSDAQADGDPILALIRGTAVNQDGRTSGLTVPNGPAQQAVIRQALKNAALSPEQVSYIEAHGTGTSLGDPIEVGALGAVFGQNRSEPLLIGSAKSNIGHAEGAAGIAGLMKVVLSLQNNEIPPHLHFNDPSPYIPWDEFPIKVPTSRTPWQKGRERIAGVSAFGFSGTNAHVVLSEAPLPSPLGRGAGGEGGDRPLHLLTLSAKTDVALEALRERYIEYLTTHPSIDWADICFTANTGRSHFAHRLSVVAASSTEATDLLSSTTVGADAAAEGIAQGVIDKTKSEHELAFLFTGQGSQYVGMGRQLYESQPIFRRVLEQCDQILRAGGYLNKPLLSILYPQVSPRKGETAAVHQTAYTQPALFALEYALAQLWKSWGVEPDYVCGHSVGEYVAACVAGVFSLEDGLRLIAERGRLMQTLPRNGEMVVLFASEERVAAAISPVANRVSIAAINGPQSVVISGERQAVRRVVASLNAQEVRSIPLEVSHAFHSPLMEPMLRPFLEVARRVNFNPPQIALLSNVTGKLADDRVATAEYWVRHVRSAVRFADSMICLHDAGVETFVEMGPKPTLLGMGRRCLPNDYGTWLPSLQPRSGPDSDCSTLLGSLAQLYVRGVPINWVGFDEHYVRRKVLLPTYPWNRQRYWIGEQTKRHPARSASASSEVFNLLQQGKIEQLASSLSGATELSAAEMKALPKLLNLLYQQHRKGWAATPSESEVLSQALPTNDMAIFDSIAQRLSNQEQPAELAAYRKAITQLNALSVRYILQTLQHHTPAGHWHRAASSWEKGQVLDFSSLAAELGVLESKKRILARWLTILEQEGILRRAGDSTTSYVVEQIAQIQDPLPLADTSLIEANASILQRCGERLVEVLQGRLNPTALLFPAGDVSTATQLYSDSPEAKVMNSLIQEVISRVFEQVPPGTQVRFIEIGAGTGGTTTYTLDVPHLKTLQTEYLFTDISPFFIEKAQQKFADQAFMRYQLLNIEQEPAWQGIQEQFDVVIASNVLHATKDLRQTLEHVQQLLRVGGMLVLLEQTIPQHWIDLTFGLTPGWWRFTDVALRATHPLLNEEQWKALLLESGFTQPVAISPPLTTQAVIVARQASHYKATSREAVREQRREPEKSLKKEMEEVPATERQELLIATLQSEVAKIIGASQLPEPRKGFFDMGMDSLMMVDFIGRLNVLMNVTLPSTLAFDYSNIESLANHLAQDVLKVELSTVKPTVEHKSAAVLSQIEALKEDEIERLMAEELAGLEDLLG